MIDLLMCKTFERKLAWMCGFYSLRVAVKRFFERKRGLKTHKNIQKKKTK